MKIKRRKNDIYPLATAVSSRVLSQCELRDMRRMLLVRRMAWTMRWRAPLPIRCNRFQSADVNIPTRKWTKADCYWVRLKQGKTCQLHAMSLRNTGSTARKRLQHLQHSSRLRYSGRCRLQVSGAHVQVHAQCDSNRHGYSRPNQPSLISAVD